jgi:hypothetical protein
MAGRIKKFHSRRGSFLKSVRTAEFMGLLIHGIVGVFQRDSITGIKPSPTGIKSPAVFDLILVI